MKPISILLALAAAVAGLLGARGESFRTDINPALLYYQAFLLTPPFDPEESNYLLTNDWQGVQLPERFGELIAKYDNQFALVRQAARSTLPCDWGIDLSAGPATLLPQLVRAKQVAVLARLRAQWHLQNGRQGAARDELLAAFALARNLPRDGTLVSVLVQIASEAILCSAIAANFGQFSPETLNQLAEGLAATPSRGTVAAALVNEKNSFLDRTRVRVMELQRENPGDDAKVMEAIRQFLCPDGPEGEGAEMWARVEKAAGGTSQGVLRLLLEREQVYESTRPFFSLPYADYRAQVEAFSDQIGKSPNPFVAIGLRPIVRARQRELRILATLAMVRAAVEYKLHGEAGLQTVTDPCGDGPFAFSRFFFEGVDRGFELRSTYNLDKNIAVLIFVEKEGPAFQVGGNYPGRPLSK